MKTALITAMIHGLIAFASKYGALAAGAGAAATVALDPSTAGAAPAMIDAVSGVPGSGAVTIGTLLGAVAQIVVARFAPDNKPAT